ncbi:MAG: CRISPR-associated endonuclease Cas3'' [Acidobacteriota bacterium]
MRHLYDEQEFFAHSDPHNPGGLPGEPGVRWQRLQDHLRSVARLAGQLSREANPNDAKFAESARWAGLLHDLGKYRLEFQRMLVEAVSGGRKKRVPHAVYGAARAFGSRAYDLALAVLGHHAGLHSLRDLKGKCGADVEEAGQLAEDCASGVDGLDELLEDLPPLDPELGRRALSAELRTRMLFSCLVDADRLDCASLERGEAPRGKRLDAPRLLKRLLAYIEERASECPEGRVKEARQEVLKACLEKGGRPGRLFSLPVPTGGGKTLSSMAFALRVCLKITSCFRIPSSGHL